jgi:hypothetical protein
LMGRRLPDEADRKGGSSCSFSEACGHSSESALVRVRSSGQLPELVEAIAAIGDSCVDNGGPHHQADNRLFHRFRIGRDANFWRRRLKSARPESRLPVVPSSYVQPVPSAIHAPPLTGGRRETTCHSRRHRPRRENRQTARLPCCSGQSPQPEPNAGPVRIRRTSSIAVAARE